MSNIHGLFDGGKNKDMNKSNNTDAYNGNGIASESPDAKGFDAIVGKAKAGG